ncbi:unnamed protein product, partial [Effrenium voratum]
MPQNLRWFRAAASFRAYALISLLALILLPTREGFAAHRPGREWLSETVLCVRCTSRKDLGERLVQVCLGLEGQSRGRKLSNRGGWQSKDLMQLKSEEFLELIQLIEDPAKDYAAAQGWTYPSEDPDVRTLVLADEIWANINRPGDWNARHTHGSPGNSLFASGVFYPTVPDRTARLLLYPQSGPIAISPEPNLLVLFPPDLPHEVESVADGADERVSIAFNLVLRWLPAALQGAHAGEAKVPEKPTTDQVLGLSAAHVAAEQGHVAVLEALGSAMDLAASSKVGVPLELAAARGHADAVGFLLRHANYHPETLSAALSKAAERGFQPVVEKLCPSFCRPALAGAAAQGHAEVVRYMLGVGQLAQSPDARTAMQEAATRGHAEVVELLLSKGVDCVADSSGQTPLHNAASGGHLDAVRLLLEFCDPCARDKQDASPLHWAAMQGHRAVAKELVAARADVSAMSLGSLPGQPLHWAARGKHAGVVQALVQMRADVGSTEVRSSIEPPLPGEVLIRFGDVLACTHKAEVLTKRKVPATAAGEDGTSPLHIAARVGDRKSADILCDSGAGLDAADFTGGSALHWAAANGHDELVADLLRRGAQPSADVSGASPLHDAAWGGHTGAVKALLHGGLAVDAVDAKGRTALHAAALLSQDKVAKLLLQHGATQLPDDQDRRPADLAHQALELAKIIAKTMNKEYGQALLQQATQVLDLLEEKCVAR